MSTPSKKLKVAVIYNTKDKAPHKEVHLPAGEVIPDDLKAELDSWETVMNYVKFIAALGHEVVTIHGDEFLPANLIDQETKKPKFDVCWNTCEGYRGFDREAQVCCFHSPFRQASHFCIVIRSLPCLRCLECLIPSPGLLQWL